MAAFLQIVELEGWGFSPAIMLAENGALAPEAGFVLASCSEASQ
jgi:hypothetical protein